MTWEDDFGLCPICKDFLVPAAGNKNSKVLLVGTTPGKEELEQCIPMVGPMSRILKTELAMHSMDLHAFRRCNLWFHAPNKNPDCLNESVTEVMKEAIGKELILLMGSETCQYFLNKGAMEVSGLIVPSIFFPHATVLASVNPAVVFDGTIGETRLALSRFCKLVKEMNLYGR